MKTAIAIVLCSSLALADEPPVVGDAPINAFPVEAGEIVPVPGILLPRAKAFEVAQRLSACEASLEVVQTKAVVSTPVLVAGIVATVAVSFAAGVATAYAIQAATRKQ